MVSRAHGECCSVLFAVQEGGWWVCVCMCVNMCVPWGSLTGWPLDPGSPWFPGSPMPPSVPRLPGGPICPGNPLSPLKKHTKMTSQREKTALGDGEGSWRNRTAIPPGQLTSLVAGATGVGLGMGEAAQTSASLR